MGIWTNFSDTFKKASANLVYGNISSKSILIAGFSTLFLAFAAFGIVRANSAQTPASNANVQLDVSSGSMTQSTDESDRSDSPKPAKKHSSEISKDTNTKSENTQLRVNNQEIPVPDNGSVHKRIKTDDGNVEVQIESHSSHSSKNSTSSRDSSTDISIESSSNTSTGTSIDKEQSME